MKYRSRNFIFILYVLMFFPSCAQKIEKKTNPYNIDSSVNSIIEEKLSQFNGQANTNITFQILENNKQIDQSGKLGEPALSFTSFIESSSVISCMNGIDDGFGFNLFINKDTSVIKFQILSNDNNILFKTSSDDMPQPGLFLECSSSNLVLTAGPTFRTGEIIQGKIELESKPFYEINNGKVRKLLFKITAYFKSEPLPIIDNQYKTLKKL